MTRIVLFSDAGGMVAAGFDVGSTCAVLRDFAIWS